MKRPAGTWLRRGDGGALPARRARTALRPGRHRALVVLEVVAVGLLGALLGLLVAGDVSREVGPFQADLSLRPSLSGATVVEVPPLGELQLDTHRTPVKLDVRITSLRGDAARAIAADPTTLRGLGAEVDRDLRDGLRGLLVRTVLVTVLGAAALGMLVFRRWRTTLVAAAAGVTALAGVGGATYLTLDERALSEPRFTGLLASAPTAVGDVRDIVERFDAYSLQLGRLVSNVSELYAVTSRLPVFTPADGTIRVLHVSDLHLNPASYDVIGSVVEQFGIDLVLDTGDSTDLGTVPETRYVEGIRTLGVPYAWVRGNHDSRLVQQAVSRQPGATVLDGPQVVELAGLRLLGQGDPRFTPDKTTRDDDAPPQVLELVGTQLLESYDTAALKPDIVLTHDPLTAGPLLGEVPLVLAGHSHERRVETVDGTTLMVQGSTGGAGLRALEGEEPTPIALTVLYLDPQTRLLQAYDEITLGGLGAQDARISRKVVVEPVDGDGATPAPTASPSRPVPSPLAR
ncbi:MAG: metallophosphoesterase [Frankiales bacterium]|nr:metallophosphoesterase [Frankiales bacterium]